MQFGTQSITWVQVIRPLWGLRATLLLGWGNFGCHHNSVIFLGKQLLKQCPFLKTPHDWVTYNISLNNSFQLLELQPWQLMVVVCRLSLKTGRWMKVDVWSQCQTWPWEFPGKAPITIFQIDVQLPLKLPLVHWFTMMEAKVVHRVEHLKNIIEHHDKYEKDFIETMSDTLIDAYCLTLLTWLPQKFWFLSSQL